MSGHSATHSAHWDTSPWPLVLSVGILFLVPLAFAFQFVYHSSFGAMICLGIGAPLTVAGIVGWTSEAIGGSHSEGLSPVSMGWFILAEAWLFLGFFAAYWYSRLSADSWPPIGSVELPKLLPAIMTAALIGSSFTMHTAEERLAAGNRSGFISWLLITIALGLSFLGMSMYEWSHLFQAGFNPATNIFATSFFGITGFHGSHVLVGLCIFIAILIPALSGKISEPFIKTGALYWHFVDIIWLFVVSQLYYWT